MARASNSTDLLLMLLLLLQVINGPSYTLALSGCGYKPKLNLSFLSYDFGPCHVFQQGMTPAAVRLTVVNEDSQPISFDTIFDNTDNWQVRLRLVSPDARARSLTEVKIDTYAREQG